MARRMNTNKALSIAFCVPILLASGCGGKPYKVAEVEGVVLIGGRPAPKILIQFIPDVDRGTVGPQSTASSDGQGRFTLQLNEPGSTSAEPGAVVGSHRVVLFDLQRAESATGHGVPVRLKSDDYCSASSTPLRQEVKEQAGKQTVEIKIP
jgi:hypothetical protein